MTQTFADRVIAFYEKNEGWTALDGMLVVSSPWTDERRRAALVSFYRKFFDDDLARTYCLGINPGRYVETASGVPYTDGYALAEVCGISNDFSTGRELTASFFNRVVTEYGGASSFYKDVYAGALFPFELLLDGKYVNFYDPEIWPVVDTLLREYLGEVVQFGSNRRVVLLGSGTNASVFSKINNELRYFDASWVLDHPRYIMQYKRDEADAFIVKYVRTIGEACQL